MAFASISKSMRDCSERNPCKASIKSLWGPCEHLNELQTGGHNLPGSHMQPPGCGCNRRPPPRSLQQTRARDSGESGPEGERESSMELGKEIGPAPFFFLPL